MDYERRSIMNTPQQLQLRKQSSLGAENFGSTSYKEFAFECYSVLQLSSEEGRCSGVSG